MRGQYLKPLILQLVLLVITNKANHFLAEDLEAIAALEDEDLLETSLGSWVSDEDMAIEQVVSDDGSTEIFFPFDYDKYQLKVLGITANKSVIVEGPPGTGKSQTISNLLVHLAAQVNGFYLRVKKTKRYVESKIS